MQDDLIRRQVVKEQMLKYGFHAPDMTVTEFIEDLPPVTPQQYCEDIAKAFQFGMAMGFAKKHDEMDKVMEEVKKAVIPQPKMGHWIDTDSDSFGFHRIYKCSECGNTQIEYPENIHERFRYCPNCGAKMESEE